MVGVNTTRNILHFLQTEYQGTQNKVYMRCPYCQTENPPLAKFCLECGKRFGACPNCGTVNPPSAKFCIECGTALLSRTSSEKSPHSTQHNGDGQTQPLPDLPTPR